MKTIITTLLILTAQHSFATGGYHCTINDKQLQVQIGGGLTRSIPSMPFNQHGNLTLKNPELNRVYGLKSITNISQFWLHNSELKVLVYSEPEFSEFTASTFTVETKWNEHSQTYQGQYSLKISNVLGKSKDLTLKGKVNCELE